MKFNIKFKEEIAEQIKLNLTRHDNATYVPLFKHVGLRKQDKILYRTIARNCLLHPDKEAPVSISIETRSNKPLDGINGKSSYRTIHSCLSTECISQQLSKFKEVDYAFQQLYDEQENNFLKRAEKFFRRKSCALYSRKSPVDVSKSNQDINVEISLNYSMPTSRCEICKAMNEWWAIGDKKNIDRVWSDWGFWGEKTWVCSEECLEQALLKNFGKALIKNIKG